MASYSNSRDYKVAEQQRLAALHGVDEQGRPLVDCVATEPPWMTDAAAKKQDKAVAQSKLYIAARLSGMSIEDANDHESVYQVESEDCPAYDDEKWNGMTIEQVAAKFGC